MLNVTVAARDRLSWKLTRRKAAEDKAMRLTRTEDGWRLRLDVARPEDRAVTHNGRNVLLLDEATSASLTHMRLLLRNTETGPRLKLRKRPSQKE